MIQHSLVKIIELHAEGSGLFLLFSSFSFPPTLVYLCEPLIQAAAVPPSQRIHLMLLYISLHTLA